MRRQGSKGMGLYNFLNLQVARNNPMIDDGGIAYRTVVGRGRLHSGRAMWRRNVFQFLSACSQIQDVGSAFTR